MLNGHGGDIYGLAAGLGCDPGEIIDMSSNVNPMGPPDGLTAFLRDRMDVIRALPEVNAWRAVKAFARRHDLDPESVLAGNGTTQLIYMIPAALNCRAALVVGPTYSDYADALAMHGCRVKFYLAGESRDFEPDVRRIRREIDGCDTVFICNPNNPTGVLLPREEIRAMAEAGPSAVFVIDESYLGFVGDGVEKSMLNSGVKNVIVLHSMSKIFKVPGLRIGFAAASKGVMERLKGRRLPWSLNSLAQEAVIWLMGNRRVTESFVASTLDLLEREKEKFHKAFAGSSWIRFYESETSFMPAKLSGGHTAESVCRFMAEQRILIRDCSNFEGLSDRFIRISLKTPEFNGMAVDALSRLQSATVMPPRKSSPSLSKREGEGKGQKV